MQNRLLSFDLMEQVLGTDLQTEQDADRADRERRRLLRAVRKITETELTGRQRQCVQLYYYEGNTMEEVGQQLGVGKATVCKHLQKARRRMEQMLKYGFDRLAC